MDAPPAMQRRTGRALALLAALSLLLLLLGLAVGSTGVESLLHAWNDPVLLQVVRDIRLPRALGAWLAGALLGLGGAVAQGLFRNPLADPYLLGSASGAALGVALALSLAGTAALPEGWFAQAGVTGAAFLGAMAAALLTLLLAQGVHDSLRLLLAGVVVGVVAGALASLVMMLRPDVLVAMQGFMLGSTAFVGWQACAVMLALLAPCLVLALLFARLLDALVLGEGAAASLGLPIVPLRAALVGVVALATAAAVAQTGLIAFVGLAAPHLVRAWVRGLHRGFLLLSSVAGGVLLLAADTLARGLVAPRELPVGVLTAILGGGYLLWIMQRRRGGLR